MTVQGGRRAGFGADRRGAIAVMTALLLPVLVGIAAYAVDASLLLYRQERLQIAADIGARAGADMLVRGESAARAIAFAETMVAANISGAAGTAPAVEVTLTEPGRLSVEARLPVARIFSQLFGSGAVIVRAGSVAVYDMAAGAPACIHLTDRSAAPALLLNNGVRVVLGACHVRVASTARNAVSIARGGRIETPCLLVAGGIDGSFGPNLCGQVPEGATIPAPAAPPPLEPDPGAPCSPEPGPSGRWQPDGAAVAGLPTARLCDGINLGRDGRADGAVGLYIVDDDIVLDRGASLTFDPGSVIVLTGSARIVMDARARLTIAAPRTGPLTGMAVLGQARDTGMPAGLNHLLGGLDVDGLIALPDETITVLADTVATRCTRILAGQLGFSANGTRFEATCAGGGPGEPGSAGRVRLATDP